MLLGFSKMVLSINCVCIFEYEQEGIVKKNWKSALLAGLVLCVLLAGCEVRGTEVKLYRMDL